MQFESCRQYDHALRRNGIPWIICQLVFVLGHSLVSAQAPTSQAADAIALPCISEPPCRFVYESQDRVVAGAPLSETLSILECIATSEVDHTCAIAAQRAIFHLADSDERRRQILLRIVSARELRTDSKYAAVYLLRYVANDETCRKLLRQVKDGWEVWDMGAQFWALVELGDPAFADWLDGILAKMPHDDVRKVWVKQQVLRVRVQLDLGLLIEAIRTGDRTLERSWLIRQGARRGVPKAQLKAAIVEYVASVERAGGRVPGDALATAVEFGLLGEDESKKMGGHAGTVSNCDAPGPKWASLVQARADEFWGLNRH